MAVSAWSPDIWHARVVLRQGSEHELTVPSERSPLLPSCFKFVKYTDILGSSIMKMGIAIQLSFFGVRDCSDSQKVP